MTVIYAVVMSVAFVVYLIVSMYVAELATRGIQHTLSSLSPDDLKEIGFNRFLYDGYVLEYPMEVSEDGRVTFIDFTAEPHIVA